jgi:hypothetical protein
MKKKKKSMNSPKNSDGEAVQITRCSTLRQEQEGQFLMLLGLRLPCFFSSVRGKNRFHIPEREVRHSYKMFHFCFV